MTPTLIMRICVPGLSVRMNRPGKIEDAKGDPFRSTGTEMSSLFPSIILPAGTHLLHCENDHYFPKQSKYPTNPVTHFTFHDSYWGEDGLTGNCVMYRYKTRRDLKLLRVKTGQLYTMLQKALSPSDFERIPYNRRDHSFPYECEFNDFKFGVTYSWEYLEGPLLAKLLPDADGIICYDHDIRSDICTIFADYEDRLEFVSEIVCGAPRKIKSYADIKNYSIYYRPTEEVIEMARTALKL